MKKVIILIILAFSVGAAILVNHLASGVDLGMGLGLVGGTVGGFIGMFVACASSFLIWVGWPIGWNFAVNNGLGPLWRFFLGYLCIVISLPVAIYQLFKPNS